MTLIRVYEDSNEYQYNNYFLVDITDEEKEELLKVCEEIREMDYEEREKKYGCDGVIECIERYITDNLFQIDFEQIDIDTY